MSMAPKEVVDYIKQEMRAGHAPGDISKALVDVGWQKDEVKEAFREIGLPDTSPPAAAPATPQFPGGAAGIATTPASSPIGETGVTANPESPSEPTIAGTEVSFQPPTEPVVENEAAVTPVAEPEVPSGGPSLLQRNLASKPAYAPTGGTGSPELQSSGLSRLQTKPAAAPSNLPVSGAVSSGLTASSPSPSPESTLGAQSTGSTLADFTGATQTAPVGEVKTPDPVVMGQMVTATPPAQPEVMQKPAKQKKGAGSGWYLVIGFLIGVLVTLLVIGGYVNFFTA